jgi:MFS family permease
MIGFACFGACGPLGATLGAIFSALVAQHWWWPCNFWILAAVALIIMGLAYVVLPGDDSIGTEKRSERLRFDWMGTLTGVTGLILVNFTLNQAPLVLWTTPYTGITLGIGILLLVAFVFVELRTSDPLVPIRGLSRDAIFALTCIVAGWASHG